MPYEHKNIDGFMQDCSISIANTLEILQSCTKPSIYASVDLIMLIINVQAISLSCLITHLSTGSDLCSADFLYNFSHNITENTMEIPICNSCPV